MLEYEIITTSITAHGSVVHCKDEDLSIDTDLKALVDALNPAELLMTAVPACIQKNMERIAPMIQFTYRGVTDRIQGVHQDSPPTMLKINDKTIIDTDENARKLELMDKNSTVYITVAPGSELICTQYRAEAQV